MKRKFLILVVVVFAAFVLLALMTGCAGSKHVWYQPGKTAEETRRDWAACRMKGIDRGARAQAPVIIGGGLAAGVAAQTYSRQAASGEDYARLCMEAKGYQWLKQRDVSRPQPTSPASKPPQ